MKTMSFKIKIMLIGASIIVAIGIVLTAIFCNIYNRPTVLADSVESSVTAPSVSVAPIKDTQPPVTTTTTAPNSNLNIQTNAPVTTVTTKATTPVKPTTVAPKTTTPKASIQTDSNGLPLNAQDGQIATGKDGKTYMFDGILSNSWLICGPSTGAVTASPELLQQMQEAGTGQNPNIAH